MKVLISSGSRGEWGYYAPIIEEFSKQNIDYDVMSMNMAPLDEFGNLSRQLRLAGEEPKYEIYCSYHGGSHYSMAKSFSSLSSSVADILHNNAYDWVLMAGDRFEQLAVASIASLMYVPSCHIQAGELSGNVDGVSRHAIGKLTHLHFAANNDAYNRLIYLGEERERIKLTGAPQLDEVFEYYQDDKHLVQDQSVLFIYHGLTEDPKANFAGFLNAFELVSDLSSIVHFILPNNDAGGDLIRTHILNNKKPCHKVYTNLPRRKYFYLMAKCQFIIGNSSSSLLEAPVYKKMAVNIGQRQRDRVFGNNIVNCGYTKKSIDAAIKSLTNGSINPDSIVSVYGTEPAAGKIVRHMTDFYSLGKKKILDRRLSL
jgi:GDP/UDP-N,N'-diacetylbacillosamine 2-epimerase (hydrolysing)